MEVIIFLSYDKINGYINGWKWSWDFWFGLQVWDNSLQKLEFMAQTAMFWPTRFYNEMARAWRITSVKNAYINAFSMIEKYDSHLVNISRYGAVSLFELLVNMERMELI